jgi:hypothetical protein
MVVFQHFPQWLNEIADVDIGHIDPVTSRIEVGKTPDFA